MRRLTHNDIGSPEGLKSNFSPSILSSLLVHLGGPAQTRIFANQRAKLESEKPASDHEAARKSLSIAEQISGLFDPAL